MPGLNRTNLINCLFRNNLYSDEQGILFAARTRLPTGDSRDYNLRDGDLILFAFIILAFKRALHWADFLLHSIIGFGQNVAYHIRAFLRRYV